MNDKTKKPQTENTKRVSKSKKKYTDAGLKHYAVWVYPDKQKQVRDYAKTLIKAKTIWVLCVQHQRQILFIYNQFKDTLQMYKEEKKCY